MAADRPPAARPGPGFWMPLGWILFVLLAALTADLWTLPEFDAMDWGHLSAPPGTPAGDGTDAPRRAGDVYWLGTDTMGRDIAARLVHGARISLSVGLIAPLIGLLAGGLLGCAAGFWRGRTESLIVAAMDVVLAFPALVLLLGITFYLGPDLENLVVALGFLSVPAFSRVARAKTLVLCEQEFVQAARLTGAGDLAILAREIIPNVAVPLAVYGLLVVAFMIMAEGALSYLGLGVPAPTPSWGGMIAEGREVLEEAPHVSMIPAAVMFLTVMAFNLMGDRLRSLSERGRSQL